jgi:hypothetical protein
LRIRYRFIDSSMIVTDTPSSYFALPTPLQLAEVQAQLAALVPAAQVQEVTSRLAAAEAAAKEAAAALQAGRVREAELEQVRGRGCCMSIGMRDLPS